MLLLNHVNSLLTKRKGFQGLGELKNLRGAGAGAGAVLWETQMLMKGGGVSSTKISQTRPWGLWALGPAGDTHPKAVVSVAWKLKQDCTRACWGPLAFCQGTIPGPRTKAGCWRGIQPPWSLLVSLPPLSPAGNVRSRNRLEAVPACSEMSTWFPR